MEVINGIVMLSDAERESIEADLEEPIKSYDLDKLILQHKNAIEKKEARGHALAARITRASLQRLTEYSGSTSA